MVTPGVGRPPNDATDQGAQALWLLFIITQSLLFIKFLLAFLECNSTGVQQQLAIIILTTRGPGPPQFNFLPTNLNVQAGRNSVFLF